MTASKSHKKMRILTLIPMVFLALNVAKNLPEIRLKKKRIPVTDHRANGQQLIKTKKIII